MLKFEAVELFQNEVLPDTVSRYGTTDKAAVRQAWNDFTDDLCKQGAITSKQYNTWLAPKRFQLVDIGQVITIRSN